MKQCSKCKEIKSIDNFGIYRQEKDGYRRECKECYHKAQKVYIRKNLYGLTVDDFYNMYKQYNNVCGICKNPQIKGQNLCVDHDHNKTINGKIIIRGLLCKNCNLGVGKLGDSVERIEKALSYLKNNPIYFPLSNERKKQRKIVKTITSTINGIFSRNCTECNIIKPLSDFGNFIHGPFGKKTICKICLPIVKEISRRKTVYGFANNEYEQLSISQNGLCAICGEKPKYHNLCVDHDHSKDGDGFIVVRGLLCQDCNMGIGKLGDTIESLEKALNYLKIQEIVI